MWPFRRHAEKTLEAAAKEGAFRAAWEARGPFSLLVAVLPTEQACEAADEIHKAKTACPLLIIVPVASAATGGCFVVGKKDLVIRADAVDPDFDRGSALLDRLLAESDS